MKKILLFSLLFVSPISLLSAATDDTTIAQIQTLLSQYAARVKVLEAENQILRNEIAKAGIKIPLSAYSGAIFTTGSTLGASSTGTVAPPIVNTTTSLTGALVNISTQYGPMYAGFIGRINNDWNDVRNAYAMPKTAVIGGYEFVQTGALDHVFVDILYTGSTVGTGAYDAKILYQYDKSTFARKLVGLFQFDKATGYYITKTGKNPFAGTKRLFIADPKTISSLIPNTATSTGGIPQINTSSGAVTNPPVSTGATVTLADIDAAYAAHRYLTTISLSTTWLATNAPTLDVLRIRYRTYFIIGKYAEALAEVEKIKSMGQLSSAVACEGYVIATYAKDTTLGTAYQKICNAK